MISYTQFKAEWLGNRVDYDHVFEFQCVDLILQFMYQCAGVAVGVRGNAIDYANSPTPAFVNATVRVTDGSKVPGDILVFAGNAGNPFGHIALRDDNVDMMLEQNGYTGNGSGTGKDAIGVYRTIPYNRVVAVYRIKQLVPAPAAPATGDTSGFNVGDTVTVTNPVDVHGTHLATNGEYTITEIDNGSIVIGRGGAIIARMVGSSLAKVASAAPAPAPAPQLPPRPANITFTKLANPMNLIVNRQPTHKWDLGFVNDAHATSVEDIPQGTPFVAFGRAQRTDGDRPAYFMTEGDFGAADTTGVPNSNTGVNTVDLSPAPAPVEPTPAPAPEAAPAAPETPAPAESEAVNVPVTVKSWKSSFVAAPGTYKATTDAVIKDLDAKLADQNLGHDQTVHVAGYVTKGDQIYYITVKSYGAKNWYGIPKGLLVSIASTSKAVKAVQHPLATAHTVLDNIDNVVADLEKDPEFEKFKKTLTPRGKAVATLAETEQVIDGFFDKINLFKKKNK